MAAVHLLRVVAVVDHVVCSDVSRAGRGRLVILTSPLVVPQGQLGQHAVASAAPVASVR